MNNSLQQSLIGNFQMQGAFFKAAIAEFTSEQQSQSTSPNTNHSAWLAGHIVSCRYMLTNLLGTSVTEPYPDLFANLKGIDSSADYPLITELTHTWDDISHQLNTTIEQLNTDTILGASPMGEGTILDIIQFFTYHEAYHIGQIGMIRKHLGLSTIKHG